MLIQFFLISKNSAGGIENDSQILNPGHLHIIRIHFSCQIMSLNS